MGQLTAYEASPGMHGGHFCYRPKEVTNAWGRTFDTFDPPMGKNLGTKTCEKRFPT